ncbi:MAG TPA: DHH family phosphoesterase [Patescibacteria group bacterium]
MSLTLTEQVQEAIRNSNNILITFKKINNGDSLSAALGLALILKKLRKKADIIADQFVISQKYNFLPAIDLIQTESPPLNKFLISLDISKNKIDEFNYNITDTRLNIFITPKNGNFTAGDVSSSASEFKYDLIFTVDTPDLDMLGSIYDNNTQFFYNTPIINIDHEADNEHYGQINLIDLTATSASEIIFNLFEKIANETMDEDIATCLLTGLICKTRSFKSAQITPKSLNIVSKLLAIGARREEIIHNLYQTKSIDTLKLWGKVLSSINHDQNLKLVWAALKNHQPQNINEENLSEIIDELMSTCPDAQTIILMYPNGLNSTNSLVYTEKNINALNLTKKFKPSGSKNFVKFIMENTPVDQAEKEVVEEVKNSLANNPALGEQTGQGNVITI